MRIRARLFASFRQAVNANEVEVDLEPPATVGALLDRLGQCHPSLRPLLDGAMVAVNLEYVGPATALTERDEVALIPPVSGG
jgi:molybdopterin converting factor subunit 1